jgi:hypothetical protein
VVYVDVDVVLVLDDALVLVRNDRDLDFVSERNDSVLVSARNDRDLDYNRDDDERPYNKHNVYLYKHKMMIHNCSFQCKAS